MYVTKVQGHANVVASPLTRQSPFEPPSTYEYLVRTSASLPTAAFHAPHPHPHPQRTPHTATMNPAAMPDVPVQVPIDDANADTEWNDILRKHKIIPEKPPSPTPMIEEAIAEARRLAHENRLEGKDLDELDELEDEEDEEFLASYRCVLHVRAGEGC